MALIKNDHLIDSIENACQFISYYHPLDFIHSMEMAYHAEKSEAAKDAIAQILINSRLSALGHRPICQDTGIVVVFLEVGIHARWEGNKTPQELIDEGVRRAYGNKNNPLRKSILKDPYLSRINTKDNTPAVVHMEYVPGDHVRVLLAAKGGGSENKSKFAVLNPGDSLIEWVEKTVPLMGAGWCPPGIISVAAGGTPEKCMLMAKKALMQAVDMPELLKRGPQTPIEETRIELYQRINNLGIGAQGLGGITTVLDVKVTASPTHAVSLPVSIIPNCAATRHIEFDLRGEGPAEFQAPNIDAWPVISRSNRDHCRRVMLNQFVREEMDTWKAGEHLLLTGTLYTARDAAHKRFIQMIERGEPLPVNLRNKFLYYVGPVDPVREEAVGPAGPTTANRMDKFLPKLLPHTQLAGVIGKGERTPAGVASFIEHGCTALIAVGGAAYLISQSIKKARRIAFDDLGMEGIYEFEVEDMPVIVAVTPKGDNVHESGPQQWKNIAFPKTTR